MKIWLVIVLLVAGSAFAQDQPELVDKFGPQNNDQLMARVENFQTVLNKSPDSVGYVILRGTTWAKYRNNRRIQGCNRWRKLPIDTFKFVFADTQESPEVEFWKVPKDIKSAKFTESSPDYRLDFDKPVELSASRSTDEYCPTYFDLDYYARFMKANPSYRGKVIIDSTKSDFLRRVRQYRKKLAAKGIASSRMTYIRHHFIHERDEQWWLIPPRRK
jgi:hypothetical protein